MCRVRGTKRHQTSIDGLRKVFMKKVTFAEKDEVIEYHCAEPEADAQADETPTETLARKRGRPRLAPEELSPLEQKEKRMKTAKEKFYKEKSALASKVIKLHSCRAFDDHKSTVARLRVRLDARAERVVSLQMEAEEAEAEWELERLREVHARAEAHAALSEKYVQLMERNHELERALERVIADEEAEDALCAHYDAEIADIRKEAGLEAAKIDRQHVLWLRGIL